jgi:hypothetical protein
VLVERSRYEKAAGSAARGTYTFMNLQQFLAGSPSILNAVTFTGGLQRECPDLLTGLYVQDDFWIMKRLMLNLGLRYEFLTAIEESHRLEGSLRNVLTDTSFTPGPIL